MTGYVTLVGAEDVVRASHNMQNAASEIQRAASTIDGATMQIGQKLDTLNDNISRLCNLIEAAK